jgi:Viral BACON domain
LKRLALLALVLVVAAMAMGEKPPRASACAFSITPYAYEGPKDRSLIFKAMDVAAYNMIAPGDDFFGLPRLEKGLRGTRSSVEPVIPPILLKSISFIESSTTQTSRNAPWGGIGPALISFDCGHGIMQVTSGMTVPLGDSSQASPDQLLVATHYAYNVARGAVILEDKWNAAPESRPIAGTDTESDPSIVENWYFAVWSYNGFTGPGAKRSNHPMDPVYGSWPRTPYSCGDANDGFGHNRSSYPYQELVWGCATRPPVVDGKQLWAPFPLSYPDLSDARWRNPLQLANWVSPYSGMDMPTPLPSHVDGTPKPPQSVLYSILGLPKLGVSTTSISLNDKSSSSTQEVDIGNLGTGVLAWGATTTASWLTLSPPAGVAIGNDMYCLAGGACERGGTLKVTINRAVMPSGTKRATIRIYSPQTGESQTITVGLSSGPAKMGVPGIIKN